MITFLAFCALAMTSSFTSFRHQVKTHQVQVRIKDPGMKTNFPGYNH